VSGFNRTSLVVSGFSRPLYADRQRRIRNNPTANNTPQTIAMSVMTPATPIAPSSTSAKPVGSCGSSTILTMIGEGGCCTRYCFQEEAVNASSASVRTAAPLGPFGR